jgi:hypothetical protein
MKSKSIWLKLITHQRARKWRWLPSYVRSNEIYEQDGQAWLAPRWEIGWLFFVFIWQAYNLRVVYNGNFKLGHECPADLMRQRIDELEGAIRNHKSQIPDSQSMHVDRELWSVLKN